MFDLRDPRQSFLRSAGHLGWAFPAGLGAKCAAPKRPVVTFTGDAGFWYHIGELETAVRWNLNSVTIVNNNHSGNQSKRGFDRAYGGKQPPRGLELWTYRETNFAKIAEDIGAVGIRVEKPGDIGGAIDKALAVKDRPVIVDVTTDGRSDFVFTDTGTIVLSLTSLAPMAGLTQANRIRMFTSETRLARRGPNGTGWLVGLSFLRNEARVRRNMDQPYFSTSLTGVENRVEEATLLRHQRGRAGHHRRRAAGDRQPLAGQLVGGEIAVAGRKAGDPPVLAELDRDGRVAEHRLAADPLDRPGRAEQQRHGLAAATR